MENERFSVPELLFRPSDIGFNQGGIAECAAQSLQSLHPIERELCSQRVLLTGGNALLPGLRERFSRELRAMVSDDAECTVLFAYASYLARVVTAV